MLFRSVRHALLCLAAGKHVLCAVPAAMTLDDCQRLIDAVRRSGLTYMMAETSHWQQLTISARKFYREGAFGRIFHTESEYHHPGLEELYFENGQRTWRHGIPKVARAAGPRIALMFRPAWSEDSRAGSR